MHKLSLYPTCSLCSDDHPESPPIGKSKFLARETDDITPAPSGAQDLQSVSLDSPRK